MTAYQMPMNASISNAADWCRNNAKKLSLWQRLLLAFQIIITRRMVVHQTKLEKAYMQTKIARSEDKPFDPYYSSVRFDFNRVI